VVVTLIGPQVVDKQELVLTVIIGQNVALAAQDKVVLELLE
jgi:hypothetical protein